MSFKDLNLIEPLERAIAEQGYTEPTPIQSRSIPDLLKGRDIIGIAQTGTGKTAAFVLPILQRMTERYPRTIRTLVLAPTRELAAQIGASFSAYGKFLRFKHTVIFGGVGQASQVHAISKGVDIVIATPGRLLDLMNQGRISLKGIEFFVLDEADRMLDMGFIRDIKKIIPSLPSHRQSFFFSATMSPQISDLARTLLRDPIRVEVTAQGTPVERIDQCVFFVDQTTKQELLLELMKQEHLTRVLVFTRTKHRANRVAAYLDKNGIAVDAIHGNKSQNARTQALDGFKSGKIRVLVATDIAARGIDIDCISHIVNYELPNEPETYVHRIGRTARAGTEGTAYSFCAADERDFLHAIEKLIKQKIKVMEHQYHSEEARNAKGAAARPPPRQQRPSNGGHRSKPISKSRYDSIPDFKPDRLQQPKADFAATSRDDSRPHPRYQSKSDTRQKTGAGFKSGYRHDSRRSFGFQPSQGHNDGSGTRERHDQRRTPDPSRQGYRPIHPTGSQPRFGQDPRGESTFRNRQRHTDQPESREREGHYHQRRQGEPSRPADMPKHRTGSASGFGHGPMHEYGHQRTSAPTSGTSTRHTHGPMQRPRDNTRTRNSTGFGDSQRSGLSHDSKGEQRSHSQSKARSKPRHT